MNFLKKLLLRWHIRRLGKTTGYSVKDLQDFAVYYAMTLEDLYYWHQIFGELPRQEHLTIIRHYGAAKLAALKIDSKIHELLQS